MLRFRMFLVVFCTLLCAGQAFSAEQAEPDPRLVQKVTIDCTGARLHTALEQISAKTGVTVHSGRSSADWRVRDIPVLVCARDIPLGVLLKAIADTNHLLLSRNRIDDLITYRIWRDLKREKELDAFNETRQAAALAAASYDWDALSAVKDLPESAFSTDTDWLADDYARLRAMSHIISELGPEVRDRVLQGETIALGVSNLPEYSKPYFTHALQAFQKSKERMAARDGQEAPESFEGQLNKCFVKIAFDNRQSSIPDQIGVELFTNCGLVRADHHDFDGLIEGNLPDFGPRPEVPKPVLESDSLPANYVKLTLDGENSPKFLETRLKVEPLKGSERPLYSNLLGLVSKETGCSIVAEGNAARLRCAVWTDEQKLKSMFGSEVAVRDVLELATDLNNIDWYIDEASKLIVGRDKEWTKHFKALVPESLIVKLNDKMQNGGFEIDDLEPLIGLTSSQVSEWIAYSPEYPDIQPLYRPVGDLAGGQLSSLYFALGSKERELAKSGTTVSLGSIDRSQLCQVLQRQTSSLMFTSYLSGQMVSGKMSPDMMRLDAFSNPDELPELSLRLQRQDLPKELGANKHMYTIYVEESENPDFSLPYQMPGVFPMTLEDNKPQK